MSYTACHSELLGLIELRQSVYVASCVVHTNQPQPFLHSYAVPGGRRDKPEVDIKNKKGRANSLTNIGSLNHIPSQTWLYPVYVSFFFFFFWPVEWISSSVSLLF